jgi:MFS family permease
MNRYAVMTALGLTQIFAWGSSYYLPAVLAAPIVHDTGWPLSWVMGGLSLGLLVAALISPRVGKIIELRGGRNVLAFSAAALGVGQLGLSAAPTLTFYIAAWLALGVGMGAGLYDAAFATLGRLYGRDARSSITTLTLFGGLSSTVCWPLSAFFVSFVGWRGACMIYAAIQLGVSLPLYLRAIPRSAPPEPLVSQNGDKAVETPLAHRPSLLETVLLATALTLAAMLSATISAHLLTLLQAGGVALATAVGLGALVGPCQVAARAIEMAIARYHHPIWTKLASVGFVAIGISALWARFPFVPAALAFYGAGIGLESIARGTLPLALFGRRGYASLMGRLGMPSLLAQAAAPWIGALLLQRLGATGMLGVLGSVAFVNVGVSLALLRTITRGKVHKTSNRIEPQL